MFRGLTGRSQTHCLADHRLDEDGVQTVLPAVLPGAPRTASGAKAALTVSEVALQAAGCVFCFAIPRFLLRMALAMARNLSGLRRALV